MTTTRRGFLAGALASGALPTSLAQAAEPAAPEAGPLQAKQEIVRRGRAIAVAPDASRLVVAHHRRRTVAVSAPGQPGTRLVDVGGQPVAVAVSPDGRTAAVTTGFWQDPGLAIVDLASGELRTRVDVGPAPFDVAFVAGGERIVVSGGEQDGTAHVLDSGSLEVLHQAALGRVPRGMAADPAGPSVWIALCAENRVVRLDAAGGHVSGSLATSPLPDCVALSPDGHRLLVSHLGTDAATVSELQVASGAGTSRPAGRLPSAVAWTESGERVVALAGAGEVVVLAAGGGRTSHPVQGSPRGLALAGSRAWTVDAIGGAVSEVAL